MLTHVEELYLLAGNAPPDIKRSVCARMERTIQMNNEARSLFGHTSVQSAFISYKCHEMH